MARRFKVLFNRDMCKGCELCMNFCPKHIISMDVGSVNAKGYHPAGVKEMDKCLGCAMCATMCPDLVITVEKNV